VEKEVLYINIIIDDVRERAESKFINYNIIGVLDDISWRYEDYNNINIYFETGEMDVNIRER